MAKANAVRAPQLEVPPITLFRGGPNPLYTTEIIGTRDRVGATHEAFYALGEGMIGASNPGIQAGATHPAPRATRPPVKASKRSTSVATRRKLSLAQEKRWAKVRAAQKKTMSAGGTA